MADVEGARKVNKRTGETYTLKGGNWYLEKEASQSGAEQRGRLNMGFGPMVQAEQTMGAMEAAPGKTPLAKDWGATVLGNLGVDLGPVQWQPFDDLAKKWGGQDYQSYTQAAQAFESQLMPIMSGAAVSPSEAKRQIKASLPELGDSKTTLGEKARNRQMMLNGAAKSKGVPLPYPDVPTYGINTFTPPKGSTGKVAPVKSGQAGSVQIKTGSGIATLREIR